MIIESEKDLEGLKKIGRIVAIARDEMAKAAKAGISTLELDEIGKRVLDENGAVSAPKSEYDFPGFNCISVNDVVAHGIPSEYKLNPGDSVNIDVSASLDGYYADTGMTLAIPPVKYKQSKLMEVSKAALYRSIEKAVAGTRTNNLGRVIYDEAIKSGFNVIRNLTGHGVGRSLHEDPENIFNYNEKRGSIILKKGHVLAIETFISEGDDYVEEYADGWTLKTPNQHQVVQFEHTVVVTDGKPIILTLGEASDFYNPEKR